LTPTIGPRRFLAALILLPCIQGPAVADRGGVGLGWLSDGRSVAAIAVHADRPALDADATAEEEERYARSLGAAFAAEALRTRPSAPRRVAEMFRDLIARAEAGPKGYDAIHHSATRLPDRPPTQLTLAEIRQWIRDTPGQQHAIGRYQVIPKTLEMLIARLGLPGNAVYSPALQDRLADSLMADAGFEELIDGTLSPEDFMDGLARIWAGLPQRGGKSAYHGFAGNRATIGRREFEGRVAEILGD
jgi:muramidase (phage lysozyme)